MKKFKEDEISFYFDCQKLINNFKQFEKFGSIYYPLKTNSNELIIKNLIPLIKNNGNGFLISHPSHFKELIALGVKPSKMCLINVLAEDGFVRYLYKKGVRYFTFDNKRSLDTFTEYADMGKTRVSIRLSITEVFKAKFSHLGADTHECMDMLESLNSNKCQDYGVSFYLQRELFSEHNSLDTMLNYIFSNFSNSGIKYLNIGGALKPSDISISKLSLVKEELKINRVILEPGRFLIGDCVDMKTRITNVKYVNSKLVVIVKNGIYSGFIDMLLYDKKFEIYFMANNGDMVPLSYEKTKWSDYEFMICGGSSDSGDRFGVYYINSSYKDEMLRGHKFYVKNIGAYFEEFFMPLGGDLIKKYNII